MYREIIAGRLYLRTVTLQQPHYTMRDLKIQIVFWVVTPCSDVVGYQRYGGPCCLHLQGEVTIQKTTT